MAEVTTGSLAQGEQQILSIIVRLGTLWLLADVCERVYLDNHHPPLAK